MIVALFGAVVAITAPNEHERPLFARPSFRRLNLAFLLGWMPVGVYLLVRYFSWSWWYYLTEEDFPVLLTVVPLVVEYLTSVAGFVLVAGALAAGRSTLAKGLVAGLGMLTGVLLVLPMERFRYIGSFDAWVAGDAPPLLGSIGSLIEWSLIGLLIGVTYGLAIWGNLRARRALPSG